SPRERLTRWDRFSMAASTFAAAALAAFMALDLYLFGFVVPSALDAQLSAVAASIAAHLRQEVDAVDPQMTALRGDQDRGPPPWQQLKYVDADQPRSLAEVRDRLTADGIPKINLGGNKGRRSPCEPEWSCRSVLPALGDIAYPFFKLMVWSDDRGWQRV